MLYKSIAATAALLLASSSEVSATIGSSFHSDSKFNKRAAPVYYPKPAEGVKTITTPTGAKIRYKEPGKGEAPAVFRLQ